MADPVVVQCLREKRAEILGRISAYEAQITRAKHDVTHINATLRLFTEPEKQRARHLVSHGFFKKGEIADICVRHLGVDGEMTTRQLAERVMAERQLDVADTTLRNSVVFKVVQALRHAKRRRLVRMDKKRKGMCVWAPGEAVTLRVVANSPSRQSCYAMTKCFWCGAGTSRMQGYGAFPVDMWSWAKRQWTRRSGSCGKKRA